MPEIHLDDLDLQIIHALQIEPRVAWTALAGILETDAVTLARRWNRIEADGLAWISAVAGRASSGHDALVEFTCEPGAVLTAASVAAADPAIYSIDLTAGTRDFIATLVVRDDQQLAEYALERLGSIPGVRTVRTHIVNEALRLGSDWNVQALSPTQQARIPGIRPPRAGSAKHVEHDLATGLRRELARNGRASHAALSQPLGITPQRVGDALARLRGSGELVLRTDVAAPYTNWPLAAWYFVQAPSSTIAGTAAALRDMPALQYASVTTGPYNLIAAAGARDKREILQVEADLERRLPRARIVDRSLVLRVHKHLGRLLDPAGRASGVSVPLE